MNNTSDIVVTDFGLGRNINSDSTRLTPKGQQWMGSLLYADPKQFFDAYAADKRCDIFSLGRVLYELYTEPLRSWGLYLKLVPPAIRLIVEKCTHDDINKRFQTVSDLKTTWQGIWNSAYRQNEWDELLQLRTELATSIQIDHEKADRLLELVRIHENNDDFLHETIMQLTASAISVMYETNSRAVKSLIKRFTEITANQSWPFDYTDKIGRRCRLLFDAIEDYEVRADVICCAMEVGINHNRWNVLSIFASMLEQHKDPGEEIPIVERFHELSEEYRRELASYLSIEDLHQAIRPLFELIEQGE